MVKQTTERATIAILTHNDKDAKMITTIIRTAITFRLFVQQSKDIFVCYIQVVIILYNLVISLTRLEQKIITLP